MKKFSYRTFKENVHYLYYYQSQLYKLKYKPRSIRNWQRRIRSHFCIQYALIYILLEPNFESIRDSIDSTTYTKLSICIFPILPFQRIKLILSKLKIPSYKQTLQQELKNILWIFSYQPIYEKLSQCFVWESRLLANPLYILHFFKYKNTQNTINWISLNGIHWQFTQPLKNWTIHSLFTEKKFVLCSLNTKSYQAFPSFSLKKGASRIEHYLKHSYFIYHLHILKKKKYDFIYYQNQLLCINRYIAKNVMGNHLQIYFQTQHSLEDGFNLFGWHLSRYSNKIIQRVNSQNIKAHQLEIDRFLHMAGNYPIDQVFYLLNQKIEDWKNFYLYPSTLNSPLESKLNKELFWTLFHFLKKRNKSKGIRWILNKYYQKNLLTNEWYLHLNQISLSLYSRHSWKTLYPLKEN